MLGNPVGHTRLPCCAPGCGPDRRIEGLLGGAVAFEVIGVFDRVAQGVRDAGEVVGGIVIIVRERGERGMR